MLFEIQAGKAVDAEPGNPVARAAGKPELSSRSSELLLSSRGRTWQQATKKGVQPGAGGFDDPALEFCPWLNLIRRLNGRSRPVGNCPSFAIHGGPHRSADLEAR